MSAAAPTLEQLRVLAAVVDTGSFSAAAKRLGRSQPVVSYMITTLESQLGFALFERGKRRPILTERGAVVLTHARRLCLSGDELAASVENLRRGVETEFAVAVDPLFPVARLAGMLREFAQAHPSVVLTLRTEPLGGVLDLVLQRECVFGISVMVIEWPDLIEPREFGETHIVAVAAPTHPLAAPREPPSISAVREHVQLALRDPGSLTQNADFSITGLHTWRVTDLGLKLEMLRAGIGWGHMPMHLVADDLARGSLVTLPLPTRPGVHQGFTLLHRIDSPPGPAGRWLMQRLIDWQ
jgi:DNA-binding transcriptional LysR family regulator